jgi:transcriptional regulator with XRE-family HTH domain
MTTLGEKIQYFRKLKGWNQADVSAKLGITAGAYAKIERNETDATWSRIEQIAKVFGITVIEMLSLSITGKPKSDKDIDKDQEIIKLQRKIIELHERKK